MLVSQHAPAKKIVATHCLRCNRPLKDPKSMESGYGPECAALKIKEVEFEGSNAPFDTFLFDERHNPDVVLRRRQNQHNDATGIPMSNIHQRIVRHSPTGFDWGYRGAGPNDLALNILLHFGMSQSQAKTYCRDFMEAFIALMPVEGGTISASTVSEWIASRTEGKNVGI